MRRAEETMTVAPHCTSLPATRKSEFNITARHLFLQDCTPTRFRLPRLLGDFPVGGNNSDSAHSTHDLLVFPFSAMNEPAISSPPPSSLMCAVLRKRWAYSEVGDCGIISATSESRIQTYCSLICSFMTVTLTRSRLPPASSW